MKCVLLFASITDETPLYSTPNMLLQILAVLGGGP